MRGIKEFSVLSLQLSCKFKGILKRKSLFKNILKILLELQLDTGCKEEFLESFYF